MTTTVNISLPTSMYKDAKRHMKVRGYSSISEFVRTALRTMIYPELTENGFMPEFEEKVLKSAALPLKDDIVFENEQEVDNYFRHLILPKGKKSSHDKHPAKR